MKNKYIFLIWNKALWCKDRIIEDINNSFVIKKQFYIKWNEDKFDDNLKVFYGRKIGLTSEKKFNCGTKEFLFVLVEDNNETFQIRDMYDGNEKVNSNTYDKKMIYRKWTAGKHRIHCSDTYKETLHDLSILFGSEYEDIISSIKDDEIVCLNTKPLEGFKSINDFSNCLQAFGDNITIINNNEIVIFADNRVDIEYYLSHNTKMNKQIGLTNINSKEYKTYILGEKDGDIPIGFTKLHNNELCDLIINNIELYINAINNKTLLPKDINDSFIKNNITNFNLNTEYIRKEKKSSLYTKIISTLKLHLLKYTKK